MDDWGFAIYKRVKTSSFLGEQLYEALVLRLTNYPNNKVSPCLGEGGDLLYCLCTVKKYYYTVIWMRYGSPNVKS